ncbi:MULTISPECIES: restriction endonuclease subunit S [unclassified Streptomyces]|uniref:restriction endonuclease subunit S n=1 Tax=unclassified Streptomyces TaxID=2593676 RepID=UPI002E0EB861|nr:restriction endonuclease subunit S [Streptomyces sp. NBC_01197]WSS49308.1 restriction endonuclease subunit S [Streptomyces sp. NBC_01180]
MPISEIQWPEVRDVGDVRMGKQLSPASRDAAGQFPYLRVANVHLGRINYADVNTMGFTGKERKTYGLMPGDILLNEGQSLELVGRSAIYDRSEGEFCFQNTLVRFRPGPQVFPAYAQAIFERWLATGVFAAIAKQTTSIAHLGGDRFASLRFPLLPLESQRRIIDVLDSIDMQVAWTLRECKKREFVEHGALSNFLYPWDSDSGGQWVHGKFGDFVHLQRGFDITVAEQRPGEVPVVSSSGISSFHDVPKVRGPGVVTGRKGKLGGVYYVEGNYWPHDTSLWVTDFKGNDPYFVAIYMRAMRLERYDAATSVPTLNRNVVHRLPASFPDPVRQQKVVALVRAHAENSTTLRGEIAKLRTLKQGVVDDLLSGRVAAL